MFRLYESTKCLSIAPLFGGKSSTSGDGTSALDRILGLDHNRMFKTCLGFPQWRPLLDEDDFDDNDSDLYDPVYVLLLLGSVLADNPPDSALTWVRLFRSNVVCLVIRSLSSCDSGIREMALSILVGLEYCLKVSLHPKFVRFIILSTIAIPNRTQIWLKNHMSSTSCIF